MNKLIAAFTAALVFTFACSAYSEKIQEDLQSGIVRLHIIADSDSEEAQAVKLKVRDAVLTEASDKLRSENIGLCRENAAQSLDVIEDIANRTLIKNGFTYKAKAYYGKFPFPTKQYASLTLPAGEYYGVRVVLGSGSGHNWWCVMYPPLCFSESSGSISDDGDRYLHDNLTHEAYDIITGSGADIQVKFKLVELLQGIKARTERAS